MSEPLPEARAATAADGQVWRDSLGRTWVSVGSPARALSDRVIREVASGTRRGTIEWATGQDDASRGLFAARRALLESLSSGPSTAAAVPRVEGVLVSGDAIVVEHPGGELEAWWVEAGEHGDRVARWLELLAGVSRSVGRLVEPAAAEGLVPVVRPRSLRAQESGRWLVTEFAPLVDLPPVLGSPDVLGAFLAPEVVQGIPSRDGGPSVVWGVGATLLASFAWANTSVDGSTGESMESPAAQTQLGQLMSDLHTRGLFDTGPDGLRAAFRNFPDPDRLPTADRDMVIRFAEQAGIGRAVGSAIIQLLDEALALEPSLRPSPVAVAERLERIARDARAAVRPRSARSAIPRPEPSPPEPVPEPSPSSARKRPTSRRTEPVPDRVLAELQERLTHLQSELEASQSALGELRTEHESLARAFASRPLPPSYLAVHLGLLASVLAAFAVGVGGWFFPEALPPERVVVRVAPEPAAIPVAENPSVADVVDPDTLGVVEMAGGTVSLSGERGVFGAGPVPPGRYSVRAQPPRGPYQDLGEVTMHAGEIVSFQCEAGVCARSLR